MNPWRCSICTINFDSDISALKCGHTYHSDCIDKWITNSKTCPNCRMANTKRDITKLFFDEGEKSFSQTLNEPPSTELLAELKIERDKNASMERAAKQSEERASKCETELRHQKIKMNVLNTQLQTKVQHIANLELQLYDQKKLKESNKMYKSRLDVCEFYNLLMRKDDEVDKYINQNGHPDEAKFLSLMRKQRDEEIKKNKRLATELRKERSERCKKEKEVVEYRKEIEQLRKTIDDRARKRRVDGAEGTSNTGPNPPRPSFGFSFTDPSDRGEVVHAAKNFAFEDDSSIEIVSESVKAAAFPLRVLDQFDPLVISGRKKSPQFTSSRKGDKFDRLHEELSEVFSNNLLAHARNSNI